MRRVALSMLPDMCCRCFLLHAGLDELQITFLHHQPASPPLSSPGSSLPEAPFSHPQPCVSAEPSQLDRVRRRRLHAITRFCQLHRSLSEGRNAFRAGSGSNLCRSKPELSLHSIDQTVSESLLDEAL